MVPTVARCSRPVRAASHDGEHGVLAGEGLGRHTRVGDHEVDPGLEVLRHPEVVERHRQQDGVGLDQFINQCLREGDGVSLVGRALLLGRATG